MRAATALIVPHTHTRKAMWKWPPLSTRNYLLVSANRPKVMRASQFIKGHTYASGENGYPSFPLATIMQRSIYLCRSQGGKGGAIRFMPVFSPIPSRCSVRRALHSRHSCVRCGAVHFINVPECILQGRLTSWNMRHARGLEPNGPLYCSITLQTALAAVDICQM